MLLGLSIVTCAPDMMYTKHIDFTDVCSYVSQSVRLSVRPSVRSRSQKRKKKLLIKNCCNLVADTNLRKIRGGTFRDVHGQKL